MGGRVEKAFRKRPVVRKKHLLKDQRKIKFLDPVSY